MTVKLSTPFLFLAALARTGFAKLFGYQVLAPWDVRLVRLDECMECEELVEETQQCAVCTCFVDAKVSLALEQCPKKKWKRIWIKKHTV